MLGAVILQIVLIVLNAIFASAEIAVISMGSAKIESLAESGDKRAKKLLNLSANPSKFLSTIQVAITLAGLLGSAYAADNFASPLVQVLLKTGVPLSETVLQSICVFLITIVLSYFSIVFGELVPKRVAMRNAEKTALGLSGLLAFVSRVFAAFVWVLTKSTNGILRLFKINPEGGEETVTEEEIRLMLDAGSQKGTIDSAENEIIQQIFKFDDVSVSEICTHRKDVVFLSEEDDADEWEKILVQSRHTFYPVIGKTADEITGVLNVKKYFRKGASGDRAQYVEKPTFVPETMKADDLFAAMKKEKNYFAVVVDEYGGTRGIITVKDLLEFLVGDLGDKDEKKEETIEKIGENEWLVYGSAPLDEVSETIDVPLSTEDWDTFGGYVLGLLDSVPEDGSSFVLETDELTITVKSVRDRRVEKTVVYKKR